MGKCTGQKRANGRVVPSDSWPDRAGRIYRTAAAGSQLADEFISYYTYLLIVKYIDQRLLLYSYKLLKPYCTFASSLFYTSRANHYGIIMIVYSDYICQEDIIWICDNMHTHESYGGGGFPTTMPFIFVEYIPCTISNSAEIYHLK